MAGNYVQGSIDDLFPGMVVPQPVYNTDMSLMLVPEGSVLTEDRIEQLRKYNEGAGQICFSAETLKMIVSRREAILNAPLTQALEDEIGYTEIKREAIDILEKIAHEETLSLAELSTVSEELSRTVEATAPSVIIDLVSALASADEYLQRHCVNVGMLNGLFGKWMGVEKGIVDTLVLVGLLHDCGKAPIPNKIWGMPRPLTIVEFEVVKTHPVYTGNLMSGFPDSVRQAARGHHEKINGRGYPEGLSGTGIPYMARISAVSDIYDAMVSKRSYKNPNSPFKILAIIDSLRDTELDGELVDVFIHNMSDEMVGKLVSLSDERIGRVLSVDFQNLEFPVVDVDGEVIQTSRDLSCVSLHYSGDEDKTA